MQTLNWKKSLMYIVAGTCIVLLFVGIVTTVTSPVAHADAKTEVCKAIESCAGSSTKISTLIKTVINIMSAIGAVIAVIMVIVGGLRYVTSNGDSNSTASARSTIIFALIGLVIVAFAQVIVQFVLERI